MSPSKGRRRLRIGRRPSGADLTISHLYRGDPLPALADFDMLAVMGGPMSVNDEAQLPWLTPEIALVRDAIAAGKIVLGVCLGAQIIAKALGAKVYAAKQKEIGWFEVKRTEAAHPILDGLPAAFTAFHWHGETFDLPAGAVCLLETDSTPNQAFAIGSHVLGLQFHMEATPASVADLVQNTADEIGSGPFEQSPDAIRAGIGTCASLEPLLDRVLSNLTRAAGAGK